MTRLGSGVCSLCAKLFGGAGVLPTGGGDDTIGARNVALALERLQRYGIPLKARRTGGANGLYLRFATGSGRVLVRPIVPQDGPADRGPVSHEAVSR
jgi:chemotaxis receptor (MCP) glutamine deamidase CheD